MTQNEEFWLVLHGLVKQIWVQRWLLELRKDVVNSSPAKST